MDALNAIELFSEVNPELFLESEILPSIALTSEIVPTLSFDFDGDGPMPDEKIYVDSEGVIVTLDAKVDISAATLMEINILKPDATEVTWVPQLEGLTKLRYVTIISDLDQVGTYKMQASIVTPSWSLKGKTTSFIIYDDFR